MCISYEAVDTLCETGFVACLNSDRRKEMLEENGTACYNCPAE